MWIESEGLENLIQKLIELSTEESTKGVCKGNVKSRIRALLFEYQDEIEESLDLDIAGYYDEYE